MLVTAHPDDETMFFSPFIIEALKQLKVIYLLCLSKGIEQGRGDELTKASKILGIQHCEVYGADGETLKDVPCFVDGFKENWNEGDVAEVVEHYIKKWNIDTIVTFDSDGVSGHPNHKHTYRGVSHHMQQSFKEKELSYLVLRSIPLPLKYLSWVGVFYEVFFHRSGCEIFINNNPTKVWDAMRKHISQYVWFRKFYLIFSTFVHMNIILPLERVNSGHSELIEQNS